MEMSVPENSVSSDKCCPSNWNKFDGFWYNGRGEAIGVEKDCMGNVVGA